MKNILNYLNKETRIFFSISNNPSNRGSSYYNVILKKKNYIYLPLKIIDLKKFKLLMKFFHQRVINFGGASISMPFKQEVLKYIDVEHSTVKLSKNANTILFRNKLIAFNTDYLAAKKILNKIKFDSVILIGSGSLASTFASILKRRKIYIYNRSSKRILKLKKKFKTSKILTFNEKKKITNCLIINTTPNLGKLDVYNLINFKKTKAIIDCAISNKMSYLQNLSKKLSIKYICGKKFYDIQRNYQKKLYLNEKL